MDYTNYTAPLGTMSQKFEDLWKPGEGSDHKPTPAKQLRRGQVPDGGGLSVYWLAHLTLHSASSHWPMLLQIATVSSLPTRGPIVHLQKY